MKQLVLLLLLLQTILLANDSSLQKVKLQLQWKYQFQFAGFIMAKELGYYKDVGLDVELIEYNNTDIIQDLEDGTVDYALTNSNISYKNKALRDVTLVATYFQKSPLIFVTRKDIKSIIDLKNKKIMISQDNIRNSSLGILFEYFDINAKNNTILAPSFKVDDLVEKKVDVITAFRSNELYIFDNRKIPYNVIDPVEYGFSTNANNLFISHQKLDDTPQEIDDFLSATKKGWEYSLTNIEKTAQLIHNKYQSNRSIEHLMYEAKVIKKLMLLDMYEIGEINKDFVLRTYHKLIKNKQLNSNEVPDKLVLKREDLQVWLKEKYIQRTEYTFSIIISLFFLIIIGTLLFAYNKMKKEVARRVKTEVALKHLAEHDALTKLPNRTLFLDRLMQSIEQAKRLDKNIAVLYMDLDKFKEVNDTLGHQAGDILLQKVATRFEETVRKSDTVSRFGGDEFVIILNNFTNYDVIINIIDNIIHNLAQPLYIQKQQIYVTLSMGISIYPHDGFDPDELLKNADAAMYTAKEKGRDNYQFYSTDMTDNILHKVTLEAQLRQSIYKKQMQVYYQIQMNTQNNKIVGMKALVRWQHPEKGLLAPHHFVPFCEEIGFINELDKWVMNEATTQFKKWHQENLNPGVLSLSLSVSRLETDSLIKDVKKLMSNALAIKDYFIFEVTESQLMAKPEQSIKTLQALNDLGIQLAIDDFGIGYSSISYLKKLPISKLKIDRSFIVDLAQSENDKGIVKAIISMAKSLNIKVIAEGVETQEQKDFLLANGCDEVQGYYYHKPASAAEVESQLRSLLTQKDII